MRHVDTLPGFVRDITDRMDRVERRGSTVPSGKESGELMVVLDLDQLPDDAPEGTQVYVDDIDAVWEMLADGTWAQATPGTPPPTAGATVLVSDGPPTGVLPQNTVWIEY